MTGKDKDPALRVLVCLVLVTAAVMLFLPRERWSGLDARKTLLLVAAASIVACRPVRISRLRIELVAFHPFLLMAIAISGARAAALTAMCGLLVAALARRPLPPTIRLLFNLGTVTIATISAGAVFVGLGGAPREDLSRTVWPLVGAGATFFLVSTVLVAVAIAMERGQGVLASWRASLGWTVWSNVAGVTIALAGTALFAQSQLAALAVTTAPCWLIVVLYRAEAAMRGTGDVFLSPQR